MKLRAWIEAMRLRTLPVSVAGVLTAVGYNVADGNVQWVPAVICLFFAILCQVASNFANEYFDYRAGRDRAGREGPRRGVTEGDITPRAMKIATFVTLAVACCLGLSLVAWGGWWLIAVGMAVAVGVYAYSTGPYPLSTHGWGEVAVVFFFGIIPVNLTYYVQSLQWSWPVAAGSVGIGLLGANVLIINNYRDIDDDRAVGKRTLAVRWGGRAMRALYLLNAFAASILFVPAWQPICRVLFAPELMFVFAVAIWAQMGKRSGRTLTPLLGATALLMFLYSLAYLATALLR